MPPTRTLVLAAFATWLSIVIADVSVYSNCQHPSTNPQNGCNFHEARTIVVSSNGCDAEYNSIQGVIDSLPHDNSSQTILVLPGNYIEQLNVTRPGPLTLVGIPGPG